MTVNAENKYKKKIFTIPNLISFFRLLLIPFILWAYIEKDDSILTLVLLFISALSDEIDGIVARKFNMISDLGKAIDPIADKLTQIAMLFGLVSRFDHMIYPLLLLVIKEFCSGVTTLASIKRTKSVKGADWHGKVTTFLMYLMLALHVLWPDIPQTLSWTLVGVCVFMMSLSFVLYSVRNIRAIRSGYYE